MEPAFLRERGGLSRLSGLFFPSFCCGCGSRVGSPAQGGLCGACWAGVKWLGAEHEARREPSWNFDGLRVAADFSGPLREAIHAYKFQRRSAFRRPFTAMLAAIAPKGAVALASVPGSKASLKEKGFDPAGELAQALAARLGLPRLKGLRRARQGPKQVGLGRTARFENAAGAFTARPEKAWAGQALLLIDDVLTTGATLSDCARALKAAGAARVDCLVLARGSLEAA